MLITTSKLSLLGHCARSQLSLGLLASLSWPPLSDERQIYSPYAGKSYSQRFYFDDTHSHTSNSGDAFANGNRLAPEQAYRLARGEVVVSSSGVPMKLSRPLDFLMVADHAGGLGIMAEVYDGSPALVSEPTLARWSQAMRQDGQAATAERFNEPGRFTALLGYE